MHEATVQLEYAPLQDGLLLARVCFNRPQALNALDHSMIQELLVILDDIEANPQVVCVWIESVTERAFCAGGDVRDVTDQGRAGGLIDLSHASAYLADEYLLDVRLRLSPKPVIAWGDGYILGGGMGVFQGAHIRIVTPHSQLAMPEVRIGFVPDCGGSWFLNRVPYGLGQALAMSGVMVNAADALYLNLADWRLPRQAKADVLALLQGVAWGSGDALSLIKACIQSQQCPEEGHPSGWATQGPALAADIRHHTPSAVWAVLERWAERDPELMHGLELASPGAALIAGHQFQRAHLQNIGQCVIQEHDLGMRLLQDGEWCEGVRALLIDKDKTPRWRFGSVADVEPSWITAMMSPMAWPGGHPLKRALAAHAIAH